MPNSRSRDPMQVALVALFTLAAVNAQALESLGATEEAEATISLAEEICRMLDEAGAPVPSAEFAEVAVAIIGGE